MVASYAGTPNRAGNAMGVLFLFLFVTFYGSSQDASSYVYCSEIFPTGVRAQGLATAIVTLFASTLMYTEVAPVAFAKISKHSFEYDICSRTSANHFRPH